MAMFPNAARGYMPFVTGQNGHKKHVTCSKKHGKPVKNDKKRKGTKTYQVTLKDRNGRKFTYIVRTDGTKSMPVLCDPKLAAMSLGLGCTTSLPNVGRDTSSIQRLLYSRDDLDVKSDNEKKEGLFSAFFRFLKEKTGKSKSGKSKRKPKPQVQRKRQRTISAMSNLDPIQESPDEYEYVDDEDDDDEDNESYNHDSEPNSENSSICESEVKQEELQAEEQTTKQVP